MRCLGKSLLIVTAYVSAGAVALAKDGPAAGEEPAAAADEDAGATDDTAAKEAPVAKDAAAAKGVAAPKDAPVANNTKDARTWAAAVLSKKTARSLGMIRTFIVVRGSDKKGLPRFPTFNAAAFNELSYQQALPPGDGKLTFQLNDMPEGGGGHDVFSLMKPDAVIAVENKGEKWSVVTRDAGTQHTLVTAPAPKKLEAKALLGWLQSTLGYDGVVLDVQDDLVLVAATAETLSSFRQAMVLQGTTAQVKVDDKDLTAAAIIEKVSAAGPYAVFRRVLSRSGAGSEVAPGSKILFASH